MLSIMQELGRENSHEHIGNGVCDNRLYGESKQLRFVVTHVGYYLSRSREEQARSLLKHRNVIDEMRQKASVLFSETWRQFGAATLSSSTTSSSILV